jgi:hypothetical protein
MLEEEDEEKGVYSFSSTGPRDEKRSKPRKVKTKQETSSMTSSSFALSSTSLSSGYVFNGGDDRTVTASGEKKNSQSTCTTTTEHATNLSSKPEQDSAIPLVSASALQHVLAVTNSIDENKNINVYIAASTDSADANNTSECTDLSEVHTMNTTANNHSRSGRRSDRNIRSMQSGTLSRGSNSIRSVGLQNISRSSHCSISTYTMASSLDTCTDSDLDSLHSEDDSHDESLGDIDYDDYRHQDQLYEKFRRYLKSIDDDDDINEYDPSWREKTEYDKFKVSNKLGATPSSSHLSQYSAGLEEFHKAAGQSESTEPSATAVSLSTLVDEASTTLLSKQDSSVEEIRSPSLPHQRPQINGPKEDNPLLTTSPREYGDDEDIIAVLSNDDPKTFEKHNELLLRKRENNGNDENEGFHGVVGGQFSYFNPERRPSPVKRKVLWANELSKQFSHDSEDAIQKEKLQDYEMSLEKKPNTSHDNNEDDDFLIISDHAINLEAIGRSSITSTSSDTLNSSNRQDSVSVSDRGFQTESSVISHTLRNSISHASCTSRLSLILRDSDRDSKTAELTSRSLSESRDSQADSSGVSFSDDKKLPLENSLSARSRP